MMSEVFTTNLLYIDIGSGLLEIWREGGVKLTPPEQINFQKPCFIRVTPGTSGLDINYLRLILECLNKR